VKECAPLGPSLSGRQALADSEMAQDESIGVAAAGLARTHQRTVPRAIASRCGSLIQLARRASA
jgi:hypothetical protein